MRMTSNKVDAPTDALMKKVHVKKPREGAEQFAYILMQLEHGAKTEPKLSGLSPCS